MGNLGKSILAAIIIVAVLSLFGVMKFGCGAICFIAVILCVLGFGTTYRVYYGRGKRNG